MKIMPTWISLSQAASKYGVSEEDLLLWVEKKEIAFVPVGETYTVDDESIQELLSQYQVIPTKEYIDSLITIYENEFLISQSYQEIINKKEFEIINLNKQISLMQKIQELMKANNEKVYEEIDILMGKGSSIKFEWWGKLWKSFKGKLGGR